MRVCLKCIHTCNQVYIHVYVHNCTLTYIPTYLLTYIHSITLHYIALHCITLHYITYIPTYIYTHIHTYPHTYIHTYIHAREPVECPQFCVFSISRLSMFLFRCWSNTKQTFPPVFTKKKDILTTNRHFVDWATHTLVDCPPELPMAINSEQSTNCHVANLITVEFGPITPQHSLLEISPKHC